MVEAGFGREGVAEVVVLEEEEGGDQDDCPSVEGDGAEGEEEGKLVLAGGSYFLD